VGVPAIGVSDGDVTATLSVATSPLYDRRPSPELQSSELSTSDADPFEIVSPELALVDPVLAERTRARLPSYGDEQPAERRNTPFQADESALEARAEKIPVISPELALVDPVLAEWARARLPDPPSVQSVRRSEPAPVRVEPADVLPAEQVSAPAFPDDVQAAVPASAQAEAEWTPARLWEATEARQAAERAAAARERRIRRLVRGAARAASLAAAVVAFAAAGFLASGALHPHSRSAPVAFNVQAQTAAAAQPAAPSKAQATSSTSVPPQPAGTAKRATPTAPQPEPRTFGWAPVAGAAAYEVEFFRAGRRIFAAKTIQPRLTLSARWTYRGRKFRLGPGVYQWDVWPIYNSATGSRRGKPIVQSRLTVTG
jgi:hypothetical protein